MNLQPDWEYVSDGVMGGVSRGALSVEDVAGRRAARLTGTVSLDNNGGFLQMAFDLAGGAVFDASAYRGIAMDVFGNDAEYEVRLRTDALSRPWQSFRARIQARAEWHRVVVPFEAFEPNKTDASFDPAGLRRIGVLAYGREFEVDIAIAQIGFVD
ncbi:MAG: CIA30 family protein [Roseobacter sp.]